MDASLYRKYRPSTFSELIGQDIIRKALTNQIMSGKISHAYLFTGSRGTGKTSTARIFARALNCEHPVNGSPCGKCFQCQAPAGADLDIIEMDAASNNGVDYIRELKDDVAYLPASGKYKIYIIDEVHMLSASAYNALLKTLEEPPSHVIFILCTTNPEKISATILSRCMRFDFKLVSIDELSAHLEKIFSLEGVKADKEAVRHIAKLGEGSVRDMLSIADRCMSIGGELTLDSVLELTGTGKTDDCEELIGCALRSDTGGIIRKIEDLAMKGKSIPSISADLSGFARDLMLVKATGENSLGLSKDNFDRLVSLSGRVSFDFLLSLVKELGRADNEIRFSISPKTVLECALLSLCEISDEPKTVQRKQYTEVRMSRGETLAYVGKIKKALDDGKYFRLNGTISNLEAENFELTNEVFTINTSEYYDALSEEGDRKILQDIVANDGLRLVINKTVEEKDEFFDVDALINQGITVEISGKKK